MPNGDCARGAENAANIKAHEREIGEMKQALKEHDQRIEHNTRCIDKLIWQVSLGAAVGAAVLAPIVSKALALLFP
jgi:hypothetical protein